MIRYCRYLFPSSATWCVPIVFFNNYTAVVSAYQEMNWCEWFKIIWVFTNVGKRPIASISVNIVINWKSVKTVFLIILNMAFLTVLIILSHILPICEAVGLKCQVICSFDEYLLICCISLVVPFRLVPQSLYPSPGFPLLLTNIWKFQWSYWCQNLRLLPSEWLVW